MTYKGKRPRGFTAAQVSALALTLLIVFIALTTHAGSEYTGKPAGQLLAETITQDPDAETGIPATDPNQQSDENELIESALLAKAHKIENCTVTHYAVCVECCGKTDGITASGRIATPYVSVAVDPGIIPLGSDVLVDYGDGEINYYRADDTGSGVTGDHIDLCVSSYDEAVQMGVRTATVYWIGQEVDEQ